MNSLICLELPTKYKIMKAASLRPQLIKISILSAPGDNS